MTTGLVVKRGAKPRRRRKRAIALDMDGVLIDGMRFHVPAWQEAFRRLADVELPAARIYLGEGVKGEQFVDEVCAELGLDVSDATRQAIIRFKRQHFREIFHVVAMPGIEAVIETAQQLEYYLALVTGTGRDVAIQALSALGQLHNFRVVIGGDDTKKGKPAPDPYVLAVRELAIADEYCLVVENAPAGITSAKAAGLKCIAVATFLTGEFLSEADMILSDHMQLRDVLMREHSVSGGKGPWAF